ncbi:MAG: hypothetical protein J2P21_16610, partial [Chloracidobacterium sp.]|nr:hypothetical protein [Chloracidobacterium sp.]
MNFKKRIFTKISAAILAAVGLIFLLLIEPQPFFHTSVSAKNLTLYSDRPFAPEAGRRVVRLRAHFGQRGESPLQAYVLRPV